MLTLVLRCFNSGLKGKISDTWGISVHMPGDQGLSSIKSSPHALNFKSFRVLQKLNVLKRPKMKPLSTINAVALECHFNVHIQT